MQDGAKHELRGFFAWDRKAKTGKLLKLKPGCRPATFKTFKELAKEMSERLRTGAPISHKYIAKKEIIFKDQVQWKNYYERTVLTNQSFNIYFRIMPKTLFEFLGHV